MKNFYMLPLACAIAALSACTPAPVKQEIIIPPTPQPAPQPLVLRKVEPEISAPHYRLNPRNFEQPLNPVVVQQIREALTPKIINPATGEVVTRLPLIVPQDQNIVAASTVNQSGTNQNGANQTNTSTVNTNTNTLNASSDAASGQSQNNTQAGSVDSGNNPVPAGSEAVSETTAATIAGTPTNTVASTVATDSNGIPVAEPQDTQAALLKIDPALILNEQAVASIAASQAISSPVNNADQTSSTNQNITANVATANASAAPATTSANTDANTTANTLDNNLDNNLAGQTAPAPTVVNNTAKILIPIHQQQMNKVSGIPSASNEMLDVTEIDKDITLIEGKARHYPVYFKDKYERWKSEKKIREITQRLDVMAVDPRASYDLLLRAMKAHVLSRNMDVGPDSAFKSAVYFQRLLKLKPADPETSFWYGFSLGEGGGFRESISHLDVAVKADYQEAYLALAHSYLQMEDKKNALTLLNNYKIKYPNETARTDQLIAEIQAGKRYSIWQ